MTTKPALTQNVSSKPFAAWLSRIVLIGAGRWAAARFPPAETLPWGSRGRLAEIRLVRMVAMIAMPSPLATRCTTLLREVARAIRSGASVMKAVDMLGINENPMPNPRRTSIGAMTGAAVSEDKLAIHMVGA